MARSKYKLITISLYRGYLKLETLWTSWVRATPDLSRYRDKFYLNGWAAHTSRLLNFSRSFCLLHNMHMTSTSNAFLKLLIPLSHLDSSLFQWISSFLGIELASKIIKNQNQHQEILEYFFLKDTHLQRQNGTENIPLLLWMCPEHWTWRQKHN